jgi:hypothetical protein
VSDSYTEVFGGDSIFPAQYSYLALAISADVALDWPVETVPGQNVVAVIIDVTPSVAGLEIMMPSAVQGSTGFGFLVNNVGAETVTVVDNDGGAIVAVASGEMWFVYLRSNATDAGLWRIVEFGAGTSTANAAALAGAGLKAITTTLNAKTSVDADNVTPVNLADGDRARIKQWTGGAAVYNLPDPGVVGGDWFFYIKNSGSGVVTVTPAAGLVDGLATLGIAVGDSALLFTDGTNFYTIGFSGGSIVEFDFVLLNVAGTGTYTLAGTTELDRISYRLTGVLTGNRIIVVPNTVQQYWIDNQTSGAFTLTVKTAAGTGIEVPQGAAQILYSDGTNVVAATASTDPFSGPIVISAVGTPAALGAGVTDNWAPSLVGFARLNVSGVATSEVTGLAGGTDGREMTLTNIGAENIIFRDESATSSAANRFALNGDVLLSPNESLRVIYVSAISRWSSL